MQQLLSAGKIVTITDTRTKCLSLREMRDILMTLLAVSNDRGRAVRARIKWCQLGRMVLLVFLGQRKRTGAMKRYDQTTSGCMTESTSGQWVLHEDLPPASSCSAPRGKVSGDWWLSPISPCCGYIMEWQSSDPDCCTLKEWYGNPNDGEPDRLTCCKCGEVCWQNAEGVAPAEQPTK